MVTRLFGPAYAGMLERREGKPFSVGGRRVHPGDSRGSPLMWMLHGRRLAPQFQGAPFDRPLMEPHPGPALPADQIDLFKLWIDLGARYDDRGPADAYPFQEAEEEDPEAKL